ncbi:TetR/AcrR family transcriptional regulator [Listeria grayi]|uniref:TetR/AcrR family transcriptional regulator n=1 Tax=Listeria grayi TaxID=1641 RepID=UPI001628B425|nr:TetR/AcrR family transcriptional regulator [Listeria grayi]MBC1922672.1 TetR/AcrR family transcriptional regulator [Listeria grayi]
MKTKKSQIVLAAKELFQTKGYFQVSVQDIIDKSSVSKGTFYNYFTSKEELAIAIFKQEHAILFQRLEQIMSNQSQTKKDNFIDVLKMMIYFNKNNGEVLDVTISNGVGDKEFNEYLRGIRYKGIEFLKQMLVDVYGKRVKKYEADITWMLCGMLIIAVLTMAHKNMDESFIDRILLYIMRRMDVLVEDIVQTEDLMMTKEDIEAIISDSNLVRNKRLALVREAVEALADKIDELDILDQDKWQYKESLKALLIEVNTQETPRNFIVQGTLLYLKQNALPEIQSEIVELEGNINRLL